MSQRPRFSDEEVARLPLPGMAFPSDFRFSPDGTHVAFLWAEDGGLENGLWVARIADGTLTCAVPAQQGFHSDQDLSDDALLERERHRNHRLGICAFAWGPAGATLIVPIPGRLLAFDVHEGRSQVLFADSAFSHAQLSPDGRRLAFTRDRELWCLDLDPSTGSSTPKQLTHAGGDAICSGAADFIAQEELGRHEGYWWHPSGDRILFVETDETAVCTTSLPDLPGNRARPYRYPFAGTPNARFRLGVVHVASGRTRWIDLGAWAREYLATAQFDPQGNIHLQLLSRDQQELLVLRIDDAETPPTVLFAERSTPWINLQGKLSFLGDGSFLRLAEHDGLIRVERRDPTGRERCVLAAPAGGVRRLIATDTQANLAFFSGATTDPRQQHLFMAALDGSGTASQLSAEPGWNDMAADDAARVFARVHHSLTEAPRAWLAQRDGSILCQLPRDPRPLPAGVRAPEWLELTAADGQRLFGALYLPRESADQAPCPLAVAVYGGPHHQAVRDAWDLTVDLRAQRLTEAGLAVLKLDNRGTGNREPGFEAGLRRSFGQIEVADQVRAVQHLVERGVVDASRVAIYGWSYGGYMAARCLFCASDVFKAAIVGAPVVRWQDYDTAYTERYMGLLRSATDREVYERASLLSSVPQTPGPMLLVHGLRDENVLFQHTANLLHALNERGHRYSLVLFPDERHGVRKPGNRAYLEARVFDFLRSHLGESADRPANEVARG